MINHILVVCVGNICRSPMGEAILTKRLSALSSEVSVSSAGVAALIHEPAHPISLEVVKENGYDISAHRARQLTPELALKYDLILTMDTAQQEHIEQICPSARGRVHRLGKWSEFEIPDPIQCSKDIFKQVFLLIEQGVDEWFNKLWA